MDPALCSASAPLAKKSAMGRWLTLVGIGEGGIESLPPASSSAISEAEIVVGGRRHLALCGPLIRGEARAWPEPFDPSMEMLLGLRGKKVCVLASGDPFHFGVGATIARVISADEILSLPAPSSFSLAASALCWPLQAVKMVSLHGRPLDLLLPLLKSKERILALTSDGKAPALIAQLLVEQGFGSSTIHVLEALGGVREKRSSFIACELGAVEFDPLNILAIECRSEQGLDLPLGCGLEDDLFAHDGQITKREVRAITLSALRPRPGELLFDIGAGSGSISIEWLRLHPSMRAIAIEADCARAKNIAANAKKFGVSHLQLIEGQAPLALQDLPTPDAIFVGGGGSDLSLMQDAMKLLRSKGRLVANGVTLEMEHRLLSLHRELGGDLLRLNLSRSSPVGTMHLLRPAMPITQWTWCKP